MITALLFIKPSQLIVVTFFVYVGYDLIKNIFIRQHFNKNIMQ